MNNFSTKLKDLVKKYEDLTSAVSVDNLEVNKIINLNKEIAQIEPVVLLIKEYNSVLAEQVDLKYLKADSDPEMMFLFEEEKIDLEKKKSKLEHAIKLELIPKDNADEKNVMLEIRAGTGGDEASIFAGNLFDMYRKYAETFKWKLNIIDESINEIGGYNQLIVSLKGKEVYKYLKFESGVHRVQRVPTTESSGRIHTSAATVAVLPEAEDIDIEILSTDLKIETVRSRGAGGQHVNTTDSAVRILHVPSGVVVQSQKQRSQHQNKDYAMKMLRNKLYDINRQKQIKEISSQRKSLVGSGDRSERIRTYNYPQNRVTDHRINLTLYKLDSIMDGNLQLIIEPLLISEQTMYLTSLNL